MPRSLWDDENAEVDEVSTFKVDTLVLAFRDDTYDMQPGIVVSQHISDYRLEMCIDVRFIYTGDVISYPISTIYLNDPSFSFLVKLDRRVLLAMLYHVGVDVMVSEAGRVKMGVVCKVVTDRKVIVAVHVNCSGKIYVFPADEFNIDGSHNNVIRAKSAKHLTNG